MAYIGPPPTQKLATPTSQYFSGNGSATAFTLNRPVNVAEDLNVYVNNVAQEPGSGKSYTATGTTLTFDAAPDAGTNNVYVVYRGLAEATTRLEHDPNQALAATTGTFSGDLTVDTNTLYVDAANNRVGVGTTSPAYNLDVFNPATSGAPLLARFKSAGGDTQLYVDNSTITTQLTADSTNSVGIVGTLTNHPFVVRTNNTERLRIDSSGCVTMPYQPSFYAYGASAYFSQSGSGFAYSSTQFNTGGHYNTSTYIFTAPVAGLYYFSAGAIMSSSAADGSVVLVANGTFRFAKDYTNGSSRSSNVSSVIYLNANDYVFVDYEGNLTWYLGDGYGFFSGCLIG